MAEASKGWRVVRGVRPKGSGGPTHPSQPMQRRPGRERIEAQVHVYFGFVAKGGSALVPYGLAGEAHPRRCLLALRFNPAELHTGPAPFDLRGTFV